LRVITILKVAVGFLLWIFFLVAELAIFKIERIECFANVGLSHPMERAACYEPAYLIAILFLFFPVALYYLNKRFWPGSLR
jgi:hypothetical protein